MAEYVTKEQVIDWFRPYWHMDEPIPFETMVSDLRDMPAADVAPVRHGRWEKQRGIYSCSECGMTCPYDVQADVIEYWACNYCPKCGAKMDGELNE